MKILLFMLLFLAPSYLVAQPPTQGARDEHRKPLSSALEIRKVKRVTIVHMPDSIMTRVNITPEALRRLASSTFEISDHVEEKLSPVLSQVYFQHEDHSPDLRWGVLFFDVQNREVGSVYADALAHYGYVNGETVGFHTDWWVPNIAKRLHELTGDPD
jgi:hypothetical protein